MVFDCQFQHKLLPFWRFEVCFKIDLREPLFLEKAETRRQRVYSRFGSTHN